MLQHRCCCAHEVVAAGDVEVEALALEPIHPGARWVDAVADIGGLDGGTTVQVEHKQGLGAVSLGMAASVVAVGVVLARLEQPGLGFFQKFGKEEGARDV